MGNGPAPSHYNRDPAAPQYESPLYSDDAISPTAYRLPARYTKNYPEKDYRNSPPNYYNPSVYDTRNPIYNRNPSHTYGPRQDREKYQLKSDNYNNEKHKSAKPSYDHPYKEQERSDKEYVHLYTENGFKDDRTTRHELLYSKYSRSGRSQGVNKPFYHLLNYNSENPTDQDSYNVRRFENYHPYLVNSTDFSDIFYETTYVLDTVTENSTSFLDEKIQECNPCNRKYNSSYPSYNDWSARYVTCDLESKNPYQNSERIYNSKESCANDNKYKHICNPCDRSFKIAEIPDLLSNEITLSLLYEDIKRTSEPFFDEKDNLYVFTSTTNYNNEYDKKYGDIIPEDLDSTQMDKYYFP